MTSDPKSSKRRDSAGHAAGAPARDATVRRVVARERPGHPRRAATILMIGIVVLLLVISVVPLL